MMSAFLLGLLGSLHCFMMCGPLVASIGLKTSGNLIPNAFVYQLGRMLVYCVLGGLAGMIGYGFSLLGFHRYLAIGVGLVLIGISVREFYSLGRWFKFNLSGSLSFGLMRWKNKFKINTPFWMGMVNGLLPCGLIYIALTGALIYDTPYESMLYMLWFGLGTCPVMIGCYLFPKLNLGSKISYFNRLFPIAIFIMGVWVLSRGLGLGIPYLSPTEEALKITTVDATENCVPTK